MASVVSFARVYDYGYTYGSYASHGYGVSFALVSNHGYATDAYARYSNNVSFALVNGNGLAHHRGVYTNDGVHIVSLVIALMEMPAIMGLRVVVASMRFRLSARSWWWQ